MPTLAENALTLYDSSLLVIKNGITKRTLRETHVNTSINSLINTALIPRVGYYDSNFYSKTTAGGSYVNGVYEPAPVLASPQNPVVSNWHRVPNTEAKHIYTAENKLVVVFLNYCHSYQPGYSETPKFSVDHSITYMQFIYANDSSTSNEITQRITARNIILPDAGTWSDNTETYRTTAVNTPDDHPYSVLWVRFVNRLVTSSYLYSTGELLWSATPDMTAQEISTYGGNAAFRVNNIIHYPNIAFINA